MSVGIHRLSLLLGILGACFGTLGAVVEGEAVYSRSQAWNSYDDKQAAYEALVAEQASDGWSPGSILPEPPMGFVLDEPPPSPSYSSRPGALSYVGVIAWPVLGFLVPWGSVRVVGWVIMGFILDLRGKRPADENDD